MGDATPVPRLRVRYGSEVQRSQDIRLTFDRVVETYDRVRPSYPDELFDALFAPLPPAPRVLEIGPGTGQATGALLARGAHVTAVELGPKLAAMLQAKWHGEARLRVVNDSFESAPLPQRSFDAVTVATAYHWIDETAQIERPLELLRPGGVLGVIDLIQVDSDADRGYFERVVPIYRRYGNHRDERPKTHDSVMPPIANRLRASGRYQNVEVHRRPWDQTYTSAAYRDLLLSYSGTQMMSEPARTAMVDELVTVVDDEFDGVLTRPLLATVTIARPI